MGTLQNVNGSRLMQKYWKHIDKNSTHMKTDKSYSSLFILSLFKIVIPATGFKKLAIKKSIETAIDQ